MPHSNLYPSEYFTKEQKKIKWLSVIRELKIGSKSCTTQGLSNARFWV
eukprot:UN24029